MTSEICIMNSLGIVLAADSAVTISGGQSAKTYNTVNKLFSLNKHDIGIMINGNANFNKLSLGIVIKEFKKTLGDGKLTTVEEYASRFINFLDSFPEAKTTFAEIEMITSYSHQLLEYVLEKSQMLINNVLASEGKIDNDQVRQIVLHSITEVYNIIASGTNIVFDIDKDYLLSNYQELIHTQINMVFNNEIPDDKIKLAFVNLVFLTLQSDFEIISKSSLVIAGYGNQEVLPSMVELELHGSFNGNILYLRKRTSYISIEENKLSAIIPFAQTDMIDTVVNGSHPFVDEHIAKTINDSSLNEDEKNAIMSKIDEFKFSKFTHPFEETIVHLPLEELPHMAETLINLTSFKRKYSQNIESVGGPVDILTITKGEGPIWINRKHYFDAKHNIEYLNRKGGYNVIEQ
ncbi:hypothetical protein [Macrococcus equipercicus]|uniref:Uncharacterized protein n=1 Tax=Macrococcus equipercicus TaxID=69967 RepID=A0A9Q9BPB3_9STAP|nr:hypothetical protein [Macrococcus equipercicus]UTH14780.1 hypothetical protein KFV11_05370 [Macrococcus equipercicus]